MWRKLNFWMIIQYEAKWKCVGALICLKNFLKLEEKFICLVIQEVLLCPICSYLQHCWVLWHYSPFMYPSFSKHSSFWIWNHKISTGYRVIYSLISSTKSGCSRNHKSWLLYCGRFYVLLYTTWETLVVSLKYFRVKGDMSPDSYSAMPVW